MFDTDTDDETANQIYEEIFQFIQSKRYNTMDLVNGLVIILIQIAKQQGLRVSLIENLIKEVWEEI